jgi:hypothetical protein
MAGKIPRCRVRTVSSLIASFRIEKRMTWTPASRSPAAATGKSQPKTPPRSPVLTHLENSLTETRTFHMATAKSTSSLVHHAGDESDAGRPCFSKLTASRTGVVLTTSARRLAVQSRLRRHSRRARTASPAHHSLRGWKQREEFTDAAKTTAVFGGPRASVIGRPTTGGPT